LLNFADIIRPLHLLLEGLGKVAKIEKETLHIAKDFLLKLVLAPKKRLEHIFWRVGDLPD
jgi:hypothetical protein